MNMPKEIHDLFHQYLVAIEFKLFSNPRTSKEYMKYCSVWGIYTRKQGIHTECHGKGYWNQFEFPSASKSIQSDRRHKHWAQDQLLFSAFRLKYRWAVKAILTTVRQIYFLSHVIPNARRKVECNWATGRLILLCKQNCFLRFTHLQLLNNLCSPSFSSI
jgi:hypothetical protein